LARELTQREGELKQKKSEADARMAELDALKTRLDKTPVQKAVASGKTVRLPVSRPIPENARIERMLATRDGIYWLDSEGAKSAFLKEFKSSAIREMKKERVKRDKETITVYDHALLTRHFEKRKLVHGDFQLNLLFAPWTPCPILEMAPRGKPSGTAVSAVLRRVEEVSRAVVMLHVTADGIENYLALRERFDRLDVPAGWTFVGAPEYRFVVSDIQTNYPVEPPKPPPPSATPPAPGTVIRPPTPKLD
jgi:hypothetical protein